MIVDGDGTDGTVEFALGYGLRVLQGKDSGIFDAINKGSFNFSSELLGFLGADDVMLEGTAVAVVKAYRESGRRWVVGAIRWTDAEGQSLGGLAAPPNWVTSTMLVCLGWHPIIYMAIYFSRSFLRGSGRFRHRRRTPAITMFCRGLTKAPAGSADRLFPADRREQRRDPRQPNRRLTCTSVRKVGQ